VVIFDAKYWCLAYGGEPSRHQPAHRRCCTLLSCRDIIATALCFPLLGAVNTGAGREKKSKTQALKRLERMLAQNPGLDYVIFNPDPAEPDAGVQLTDRIGALFFAMMRTRATGTDESGGVVLDSDRQRACYMIYEQLTLSATKNGIPLSTLHSQLCEEYGPFSVNRSD